MSTLRPAFLARSVVLAGLLCGAACPAQGGPPDDGVADPLDAVLRELREAERRPWTGTLRWTSEYLLHERALGENDVLNARETGTEVRTADGWRVDLRKEQTTGAGERQGHRYVSCFDGTDTVRTAYFGTAAETAVVNVLKNERRPHARRLDPYLLPLRWKGLESTFSQWLTQDLAAADADEAISESGRACRLRHLGTEERDGLRTHVLQTEHLRDDERSGEARSRRVYSLAPDRGYLPIYTEGWDARWSTEFPMDAVTLSDFKQAPGGRWYPGRAVHEKFSEPFARRGVRKLVWRQIYTLDFRPGETLSKEALCRETRPPNSRVYVIENGEFVDSDVTPGAD